MDNEITDAPQRDFYIKLDNQSDMPTALAAFYTQDYTTVTDADTGETSDQVEGSPYLVANTSDYTISIIGVMSEKTGETTTDDMGNSQAVMQDIDGWHINIRISGDNRRSDVEAVNESYGVEVNSPSRRWL